MPTIVDSLVVLLDLDVSGFEKGFKKTEKKTGELKKGASSLKDSFGAVRKGIGEVASEVTKFLAEITGLSAAVGMLSKNIDVSATDILAWGNAAEKFGGSAGGIENAMKSISMSITDLQMTGESGMLQYFQMLNVSLVDAKGEAREADDILLRIADGLQQFDRPTAYNIAKKMGFDEGTVNLLLEGRQEIEKTLEQQKKLAEINTRFAETSQELKDRWLDFGTALKGVGIDVLEVIQPALVRFFDVINQGIAWLHENKGIAFAIFSALAFVISVVLVAAFGAATKATWVFSAAIVASLKKATIAALKFAAAMLANPVTWIVLAVLALVAAIALLIEDYHVWAKGGKSAFDWSWLQSSIGNVAQALEWLSEAFRAVSEVYNNTIAPVLDFLIAVVGSVIAALNELDVKIVKIIDSWLDWIGAISKKIGKTAIDFVIDKLKSAYDWIDKMIKKWREWWRERFGKKSESAIKQEIEEGTVGKRDKAEERKSAEESFTPRLNAAMIGRAEKAVEKLRLNAAMIGKAKVKASEATNDLVSEVFLRAEGDYDSVNLGEAHGYKASKRPLEQMTVAEVMAAQQRREFNAAGRYQIIRTTMEEVVRNMGLTGEEKFDRKLQDRIFREYLIKEKRKEIWAYISGKSDDIKSAMIAMSKEWASFADPRTGRSYYDKDGINKSSVTPAQSQQLLMQMRETHLKNQVIYNNVLNKDGRGPYRTSTRIDSINVYTNAEDGHKIAREIRREINSNPLVDQANMGLA